MLQGPKITPQQKGMKPEDYHLVISAATNKAQMFTSTGVRLWEKPALPVGQHADWRANKGDTPPGLYYIGQVWRQYLDSPSHFDRPYGWICFDLVDVEGNEDKNGRGGVAIHGGGSGLPGTGYWSDYQPLLPTHGCVRMHNKDLLDIDECVKKGRVWVSVWQDDK